MKYSWPEGVWRSSQMAPPPQPLTEPRNPHRLPELPHSFYSASRYFAFWTADGEVVKELELGETRFTLYSLIKSLMNSQVVSGSPWRRRSWWQRDAVLRIMGCICQVALQLRVTSGPSSVLNTPPPQLGITQVLGAAECTLTKVQSTTT